MKAIQYTIRNIPTPVDQYLRKKSRLSGKSLNQVILDELSEKVSYPTGSIGTSLDWFIGKGMDDATLQALTEQDAAQKTIAQKEMKKLDDLGY